MRVASALALILALAQPAQALTYTYQMTPDEQHFIVRAWGDIQTDEKERFLGFLSELPERVFALAGQNGNAIILTSHGGMVDGGIGLGVLIEGLRMSTGVSDTCSSACVLAWAAGVHKSVNATDCVGVHQGAPMGTADQYPLAPGPVVTGRMETWLTAHGAPKNVIKKMNETPPSDISCLTPVDLAAWGANIIGLGNKNAMITGRQQ